MLHDTKGWSAEPMIGFNKNALHLAEGHIVVEQLRLIYASLTVSVLPMFPAIFLLVWALINPSNRVSLVVWAVAVSLTNFYSIFDARRRLRRGISELEASALVHKLIISMAIGGAAWGALSFGALGKTTAVGDVVVICVLSGILGGSVGLLSPVLPVFIAFSVPMVGFTVAKLWQLGNPAYSAFGVISIMYLGVLIAQTRNSSRATRAAIELRFENLDLMREAEAARLEAVQASTAKSKFLAAASHDLRQPVHAQGLFLDVLSRTPLTPQQRELVTNISATSAASADMLNTLLDFSRIEAGVVQPHMQAFPVQHLLNKIEREFEPQADGKGLAYRSRETALMANSDPALVELILRNLVSNAIRYTDSGGLLVVCRQRAGSHAALEVWDTGIGIAKAHQNEVFKEFHQLGNPERDRHKGLGLGLAIAQGLTRTLNQTLEHRLSLKSRPRRGSVFSLQLPIAHAAEDLPTSTTAQIPTRPQLYARVLVIDDEEAVRAGMLHLLRDWGCICEAADSIDSALDMARQQRPDVVISDYRLREQSTGLQAIRALRALLGNDLPAVLITGDTAPERLRDATVSGVPLLHKPVTPQQLYQALVAALDSKTSSALNT